MIISFKFCSIYRWLIEKLARDSSAYRRMWWKKSNNQEIVFGYNEKPFYITVFYVMFSYLERQP